MNALAAHATPDTMSEVNTLLGRAETEFHSGRPREASEACRRILEIHGDQPGVWFLLGATALEAGEADQAVEALRRAIALRPARPEYHATLGRAERAAGRLEEAAVALRCAVELAPDCTENLLMLGALENQLGRRKEALGHNRQGLRYALKDKRRAMKLRLALMSGPARALLHGPWRAGSPISVATMLERAAISAKSGARDQALLYCREALKQSPGNSRAIALLGNYLCDAEDFAGALAVLEDACAAPDAPHEVMISYGRALCAAGRFDDAIRAFDAALSPKSRPLAALLGKAKALCEYSRAVPALDLFHEALKISPANVEGAYGVARCLQDLGRIDEARVWLDRTLGLAPGHSSAYFDLARNGQIRVDDPVFKRLQTLVENPNVDAKDRSILHIAAAVVLDRAGDSDAAFASCKRGNELKDVTFSRQAHSAEIDALVAACGADFFQRVAGWGADSDAPVFILGMPRSGTSLVEQILASHADVFGAGELTGFFTMTQGLGARLGSDTGFPRCLGALDRDAVAALSSEYLAEIRALAPDAPRVTDKMPNNYLYLGLIAALFPKARVIHCRRHPLDICLSIYFLAFQGNHPYAYNLENLGHYYREYERLMAHWRSVLPIEMLDVQYEDVVADQEGMTRKILEFCGLEWDPNCLAFYRTERAVHSASYAQVRKPIYSSSVARWKPYERHLEPLMAALEATAS